LQAACFFRHFTDKCGLFTEKAINHVTLPHLFASYIQQKRNNTPQVTNNNPLVKKVSGGAEDKVPLHKKTKTMETKSE